MMGFFKWIFSWFHSLSIWNFLLPRSLSFWLQIDGALPKNKDPPNDQGSRTIKVFCSSVCPTERIGEIQQIFYGFYPVNIYKFTFLPNYFRRQWIVIYAAINWVFAMIILVCYVRRLLIRLWEIIVPSNVREAEWWTCLWACSLPRVCSTLS